MSSRDMGFAIRQLQLDPKLRVEAPAFSRKFIMNQVPDSRVPFATVVGALIGATTCVHPANAAMATVPTPAIDAIQRARVDIYCSHNTLALVNIRAAGVNLQKHLAPISVAAITALDQAAWSTRHQDYRQAVQALDRALLQLAGGTAVA